MKTVRPEDHNQSVTAGLSLESLIEELTIKDQLIKQKSYVIDHQKRHISQLEEYWRVEKKSALWPCSEKLPGSGRTVQ